MWQDHADRSHDTFWQQLMRYLVTDTPGQVSGSTPHPVVSDEGRVELRAEVRDKEFSPRSDVTVQARIMGPEGAAGTAELTPQPAEEGVYTAEWNAEKPGSYVVEMLARRGQEEIGRDVFQFRREDGVAENFHTSQNRELLEKLASADRRAVFHGLRRAQTGERDLVLRGRHHHARDARPVGHAGGFPAGAHAARLRMDAAAQMGCRMRRGGSCCCSGRLPARPPRPSISP